MQGATSLESPVHSRTSSIPAPAATSDATAVVQLEKVWPGESLTSTLAISTVDALVRIVDVTMEPDVAEWLAAVGIGIGDRIVVLRRAAFGGPLHVRTASGGEFAIHRSLAESVVVQHVLESTASPRGA